MCLKLNGKWIKSSTQNQVNLIWCFFTSSAATMRNSAKKQQSQVQTIQRAVHSRNATQDNGNINNFWKGSRLAFNVWGPFVVSYDRIKKMAVCKTTFVSEHLNTDQFPLTNWVLCTCCMLCLLQSWRFQLTALPRQTSTQRAQSTWSTLTCSIRHAHICINPNAKVCLKALCSKKSVTSTKKFAFDFC